jgi:hypothetical protein
MKHLTILLLMTVFLVGCSRSYTPKETVATFVTAVKKLDFETAQKLLTDETKSIFTNEKINFQNSSSFQNEMTRSKSLTDNEIRKEYGLDNLLEITANKNATVFTKDSANRIQLEEVGGSWKIICTKNIVNGLLFENQKLEAVKSAYNTLLGNYKRKTDLLLNIIGETQSPETNAIRAKIKEIDNFGSYLANAFDFGTKQNELETLSVAYLSKVNPMSNLAIQLEGTENRISLARRDFNYAVIDNNSGFGQKIKMLPANVNRQAAQVQF